jgi:hypothetical protein
VYEIKKKQLKQVDIMVIGSSVALDDVNSKIMTDTFRKSYYNFGSWNLQVADTYNFLKGYYANCQPKYVIFASTFADFLSGPNGALPDHLEITGNFLGYYYLKNFANLNELQERKALLSKYATHDNIYESLKYDDGGGIILNMTKKDIIASRYKMSTLFFNMFPSPYTANAYKSLGELAAFLKSKHVKLIFIQVPLNHYVVKDAASKTKALAHFNACKSIVEANGGTCFNYVNSDIPDSLYADPMHLSGAGSAVLTKQIARDLKSTIY